MKRFLTTAGLGAILAMGAWALYHRDQISSLDDALKLAGEQFSVPLSSSSPDPESPFAPGGGVPAQLSGWSQPVPPDRLRIATFNIQALGKSKAARPTVMNHLLQILSRFDVIAIQEIRDQDQVVLPALVQQLNQATGRQYRLAASPPAGRSDQYREQSAFVFDLLRVRLDDAMAYSVQDPEQVLIRPPYVGWFRAATPHPGQAFTFSLVNMHLDSRRPEEELNFLREIFRQVRMDGRGEDDVIIVGDFNAGDRLLEASTRHLQLTRVVQGGFTNTRGTSQYDNILFDSLATSEFLGQGGVFDFLKNLNLTLDEALEISDHMPVWADFSVLEGGPQSGSLRHAQQSTPGQKQQLPLR